MTIGVIDTGVDLNNSVLQQANIDGIVLFKNEAGIISYEDGFSSDEKGHGTPIVSAILSHTFTTNIFVVKVTSFNGAISEDLLEQAITYLLHHTDAVIINISMGIRTAEVSATLLQTCREAFEKGVVIVAAAHSMTDLPCYPAHFSAVLGVGEAATNESNSFYYIENTPTNLYTKGDFKQLPFPNQQFNDCKGTSFAAANLTGIIGAAYLRNEWRDYGTLKDWLSHNAINQYTKNFTMENTAALLTQCKQFSKDDSGSISKKYFNEQYGFPAIPVLFTKAFQDWDIKEKWSLEYLSAKLLQKESVNSCDAAIKNIELTLEEYLQQDTSGLLYYNSNKALSTTLSEEFHTPDIFNCWYKTTSAGTPSRNLSWLFVGTPGTYTGLHTDIWNTDAWNYLLQGRKLWVVYPEIYNDYIRKNSSRFRSPNLPTLVNQLLAEDCKPLVCIQEAGQMIYMPGRYYHAVFNLDTTISVTENFINEINYDHVRGHIRSGANKKNIHAIESVIKEGFLHLKNAHQ